MSDPISKKLASLSLRQGIFRRLSEVAREDIASHFDFTYPEGVTEDIDINTIFVLQPVGSGRGSSVVRRKILAINPVDVVNNEIMYTTDTEEFFLYQNVENKKNVRVVNANDVTININRYFQEGVEYLLDGHVSAYKYVNGMQYIIHDSIECGDEFDFVRLSKANDEIYALTSTKLWEVRDNSFIFIDYVRGHQLLVCEDRIYINLDNINRMKDKTLIYFKDEDGWDRKFVRRDLDGDYMVDKQGNIICNLNDEITIFSVDFKYIIKKYLFDGVRIVGVTDENKIVLEWNARERILII